MEEEYPSEEEPPQIIEKKVYIPAYKLISVLRFTQVLLDYTVILK